jgi:hypothetical protein
VKKEARHLSTAGAEAPQQQPQNKSPLVSAQHSVKPHIRRAIARAETRSYFKSLPKKSKPATLKRKFEPAPPDPGIIPGGIRDRALRAMIDRIGSAMRTPDTTASETKETKR